MLKIRCQTTGETADLVHDVRHTHPEWVHTQLGTSSESDLQGFLDACDLEEFAVNAGEVDDAGVFMAIEDATDYLDEL